VNVFTLRLTSFFRCVILFIIVRYLTIHLHTFLSLERGNTLTTNKKKIPDTDQEKDYAQQKTTIMGTLPIPKLLAQFSIPAVIAMLVNAIYNIVDRIFIGNFVGENALAGLTISFPIMMIIFAFAGLVGIGGSALMSIHFGRKDFDAVSNVFGNMLSLGSLITMITLVTIFFNLDAILLLFGATQDILGYATDYMNIILLGFIFQMWAFSLNGAVRTEGHPMLSMMTMLLSAITNIVLDYLFIVRFNWGVQGAAIATISGQFVGLLFLVRYYLSGNSALRFKRAYFIPKWSILNEIVVIGFSTFIAQLGTSVSMIFINRGLALYGGVSAITSMGAINSLFTLFIMPIMGLQQGLQPIIGYNYGANSPERVKAALKLGLAVGTIFSTFVFIVLQLFPDFFVSMFLDAQSSTVSVAARGLQLFILMLPLLSINLLGIGFFQSIAKGRYAVVLGSLRQFVILLPVVIILPKFLGLTGVWLATPIADGIAILLTILALFKHFAEEPHLKETSA